VNPNTPADSVVRSDCFLLQNPNLFLSVVRALSPCVCVCVCVSSYIRAAPVCVDVRASSEIMHHHSAQISVDLTGECMCKCKEREREKCVNIEREKESKCAGGRGGEGGKERQKQ
jgi:hypothetical protein